MGWATLAFLATLPLSCSSFMVGASTNDILQHVLRTYESGDLPRQGSATELQLGIYINQMTINKVDRTMTLDIYMRQKWNDPRLVFTQSSDTFRVPYHAFDNIWKPDTFFKNAKNVKMFHEPEPHFLMKLSPTGDVWYVYRTILDLYCPQLGRYRHSIRCTIMFESFGYKANEMSMKWLDSAVDIDPAANVEAYTLKDKILYDCSQNYTAGTFPCLEVGFLLDPELSTYLPVEL